MGWELLAWLQAGLSHTLGRIEFEDLIGKAARPWPDG
ncbi:hypothetical protein O980_24335 [Mycobacterium avium subsp. paratuberculosis 08-8281]|nr:hypothetical protein O980_24335 [Mycobacterium avium subsp. paratuberculosis 08-8281]